MIKKIVTVYWHGVKLVEKYEHHELFEYSKKQRNIIIDTILESGNNVMLIEAKALNILYIWIDSDRFRQK
jgi:hypothetical protein